MTTLEQSYARGRELSRTRDATFYRATFLLPKVKRHHAHALYGFCRHAGEVVDELGPVPVETRQKALATLGERFFDDLDRGDSSDLVLKAVVHTVVAFDINPDCFRRFLRSKTMDLTVTEYDTFDDLLDYMDGAAAVIGEMLLPLLEPTSAQAFAHARDLGIAFGLTTFLRDVSADLDRGRVYLPQEDITRFGADPRVRRATPEWRALMSFEIERAREYFRSADLGLPMLPPSSARCVLVARRLYGEILDRIERAGGDVFSERARVTPARQALIVGRSLLARDRW